MSLIEARAKRARRGELVADAGKILTAAKRENRELTKTETQRWTELHESADELLDEAKAMESAETRDLVEEREPSSGFGGLKALRRDRSCASQMRRPGDREIEAAGGLGALIRDRVLGTKRAQSLGTDVLGGFLVDGGLMGSVLDLLRAKNQVLANGGQLIQITPEQEARAVLTSEPAALHHAENDPISEDDILLGQYRFEPKTLVCPIVRASVELIEDAPGLGDLVERSFAASIAAGIDSAALTGQDDGDMTGPRGLGATPGVGSTDMASNYLSYDSVIDGRSAILEQDADEPNALIHSVKQETHFAKIVDGEGNTLPRPPAIQGVRFAPTTRLTDKAFLGKWSHLHVLFRNRLQIEILRERYKDNLQYGFLCWFRYDVVIERPEAFHAYTSVSTA